MGDGRVWCCSCRSGSSAGVCATKVSGLVEMFGCARLMFLPQPPGMHPPATVQAVGTRTNIQCLEKWYSQLSPSMVARGEWGSGDDRRLLRALYLR